MSTAARAARTRRQQVSPSISSLSDAPDGSFSSALEAEAPRRGADSVRIVQSVDFDDFMFRSQAQTFGDGDADAGAEKHRVAVVDRQRADDARREAFRSRRPGAKFPKDRSSWL
jgi:hypothetical protein